MDTAPNISWLNLLKTIDHFKSLGYSYIEVPWLVTKDAVHSTFDGSNDPVFQGLHTIGSGEQGFVQLQLENKLAPGKYITLTPCFRDEQILDELHQLHFAKVEIYINTGLRDDHIKMIKECGEWFDFMLNSNVINPPQCRLEMHNSFNPVDIVDMDLTYKGIELGSYGMREYKGHVWSYGTALAEPRFSVAMKK